MEEKKIYHIVCEYTEADIYVLLTEAQAEAIKKFIVWGNITCDFSIEEVGNIVPTEW